MSWLTSALIFSGGRLRAGATRAIWSRAAAGERCGSSPLPLAEHRADEHGEHHRIAPLDARIELAKRVGDRGFQQRRLEDGALRFGAHDFEKRKCGDVGSERAAGAHEEVLDDRAERERGEKGERADDEDHGEEEDGEGRAVGRKSARARRRDFFRGEAASPRYSGVRPTIRPARKTVRMTNISIP